VPGEADGDTDFLNGGAGDDRLVAGSGDYLTGGEGADRFQLGDWLEEGDSARITDFDKAEDSIEVVYDPAIHPDPQLTLQTGAAGEVSVYLDGLPLAVVTGAKGLTLGDFVLTPVQAA